MRVIRLPGGFLLGYHDAPAAGRALRRSPGFVIVAVPSLGIAIGNCAVGIRTRESAMRTAHGAQAPDILRIVVRDAMEMVLGGTAVGATTSLVIGFGAFQAAGGLGALALAAAETVVIAASLAACIAPTRRATRADPVDLLRST